MFFMDCKGTKAWLNDSKRPFAEKISHVGIYLGDGKMQHAYFVASGGVRVNSIEGKHWEYRFLFGAARLIHMQHQPKKVHYKGENSLRAHSGMVFTRSAAQAACRGADRWHRVPG
ncbi:NlpC/P60 family protein [Cohnella soli]|uniref:NlpC/P60 family protein n=1 Tax=Cohnella soli TaxID=425005 RepID=A0ABW0I3V6_9BACL